MKHSQTSSLLSSISSARAARATVASLATCVVALAGCSAAVDAPGEPTGSTSSADSILGPPIYIPPNPLQVCTSITPTVSLTVPNGPPYWPWEVSPDAASPSCDYSVLEVTGTEGAYFGIAVTDAPAEQNTGISEPPTGVADAASCAASYMTYESMGYLPPHLVPSGLLVTLVPGEWVEAGSGTISGTWLPAENRCAFPSLEQGSQDEDGYGPLRLSGFYNANGQCPYSTIRVAARMNLVTPSGDRWPNLYYYVT